jgi:CheY-like chemotaxis protein
MSPTRPNSQTVVLIVEDESLIRMLGVDVLEDAGFTVLEAANGLQALAALNTHPEIDVMFTDINMPGRLDGLELAARVREEHPHVGVLIASGKVRPSEDELPRGSCFLAKPWGSEEVVRTIQGLVRPA